MLTVGCKAYYDSFNGLIPCKVISIESRYSKPSTAAQITIELTADRCAYNRGEYIVSNSLHVIPRDAVYQRNGQYRIGVYQVESNVNTEVQS